MSLSTYVSNTLSVLLPFQKNPMLDKFSLSQIGAFSLFQRKSTLSGSDLISLCTQQGLAGNEKWRKGWLTLTLPICTFYPPPTPRPLPLPPFYRPFCTKYISEWLGWIFVFGWLDLKEGNLSRLKSQHRGCILNRPRREKARIQVSVPIPVNNMVWN